MLLWGFGPIWKAIISLLKTRIKEAEKRHAANQQKIKETLDAKIAVLETEATKEEEASVQEQVTAIFAQVKL